MLTEAITSLPATATVQTLVHQILQRPPGPSHTGAILRVPTHTATPKVTKSRTSQSPLQSATGYAKQVEGAKQLATSQSQMVVLTSLRVTLLLVGKPQRRSGAFDTAGRFPRINPRFATVKAHS